MTIIKYEPQPPITEGSFLRAGWAPKTIGGSIIDISGNAKHGTQINGCAWENDPYFGSIIHGFGVQSQWSFPATLSVSGAATFGCWYKIPSLTSVGADNYAGLFCGTTGNDLISIYLNGSAFLRAELQISGVARSLIDNQPSRANVWTLAIFTYDGDKIRIYADGVLRQTSASYPSVLNGFSAGTAYFGGFSTVPGYGLDGVARSPFILNKCWSQEEITQYYNLAKVACWKTDFGVLSTLTAQGGITGAYLSNSPFQFADTTGRFYVETDTINGKLCKVIRCSVAGSLYIDRGRLQQEAGSAAFGEWEWYYYRTAGSVSRVAFISSDNTLTSFNGYEVYTQGTGILYFLRYDVGAVGSYMAVTTTNQAPLNVWTKFNVKRSVAGIFTFYINDIIPPLGTGTDPVTDTQYLSSNYLTISAQVGDKIALGSLDGSNALVKRIKA
jgi:hypothetical protein